MRSLLADGVLLLHGVFILFAVFGGLLVLRHRGWAWIHVPSAAWAVLVEWAGWPCPLTFLEDALRGAEWGAVRPDFIDRVVGGLIYPAGLTRLHQILLGFAVAGINLAVYGWAVRRWKRR